jgi:hypothetical protein
MAHTSFLSVTASDPADDTSHCATSKCPPQHAARSAVLPSCTQTPHTRLDQHRTQPHSGIVHTSSLSVTAFDPADDTSHCATSKCPPSHAARSAVTPNCTQTPDTCLHQRHTEPHSDTAHTLLLSVAAFDPADDTSHCATSKWPFSHATRSAV